MKTRIHLQELVLFVSLVVKGERIKLSLCFKCPKIIHFFYVFGIVLNAQCFETFFLIACRSLIANLSAANCYKSEHLKKPENWALGTFLIQDLFLS
jgi:hypothetical protein